MTGLIQDQKSSRVLPGLSHIRFWLCGGRGYAMSHVQSTAGHPCWEEGTEVVEGTASDGNLSPWLTDYRKLLSLSPSLFLALFLSLSRQFLSLTVLFRPASTLIPSLVSSSLFSSAFLFFKFRSIVCRSTSGPISPLSSHAPPTFSQRIFFFCFLSLLSFWWNKQIVWTEEA